MKKYRHFPGEAIPFFFFVGRTACIWYSDSHPHFKNSLQYQQFIFRNMHAGECVMVVGVCPVWASTTRIFSFTNKLHQLNGCRLEH